jgi:hypothetical protein
VVGLKINTNIKTEGLQNMSKSDVVIDDIKYYIFVKKDRRHFNPQYVGSGATTIHRIFPIPKSDTVGALDKYCNGIVFLKFGDYGAEPTYEVIAKDFSKEVYGSFDYSFSHSFSKDTIAYCKTRVAVIANVEIGEAFHAGSSLFRGNYMLGIRFLSPQKKMFVVFKSIKDKRGSGWDNYLHIAKLESQQLVDTNWIMYIGKTSKISPDFPLYNIWFVHNNKLFVLDRDKAYPDQIVCTDGKQSIPHPFSTTYNANVNQIGKIKDIALHPKLPFGVMIEERVDSDILHGLVIIRWDTNDPDEQVAGYSKMFEPLAPLFGLNDMALAYSSFSPCGNWYIVGCIAPDATQNPHFIALPVDPEHPDLLDRDNIIILGQVKNMTSLAWTSDPTSYVVSNGELLHKWDLDELPNADVIVMPEEDGGEEKKSIFRRIGGLFGRK